jgi:hypothetical protein
MRHTVRARSRVTLAHRLPARGAFAGIARLFLRPRLLARALLISPTSHFSRQQGGIMRVSASEWWTKLSAASLVVAFAFAGCISSDSGLGQAAQDCQEFKAGAHFDSSLAVDDTVRIFMQGSADLLAIGDKMKPAVKAACAHIATDLGASDTWSALGDGDDSITNDNHTGACDVASAKVGPIMEQAATANFALIWTHGACRPDFEQQKICDTTCKTQNVCDSGSIETRCDPGSLSVQCSGSCSASAFCEGTPEHPANCMGACESTCTGQCAGTCISADGKRTDNDLNCHGKCSSGCNGKCEGRCKIDAPQGLNCGEQVSCRGGCTGTFTAPTCETEFKPPQCMENTTCWDSCSTSSVVNTVCDPPGIQVFADPTASPDVQKLVASLNANLPAIVALADAEGAMAAKAGGNLIQSGNEVLDRSGDLDGKSLACAKVAAQATVGAVATISAVIRGGGEVTDTTKSHAN